jgi:hypothetical protein
MTQEYSIKPCIEELERFFAFLNKKFDLKMPSNVIVTVQSQGRVRNAMGWFKPQAWQNGKEPAIHEINVCAEFLQSHPYETMAHEVAHLCTLKTKEKFPANNYHSKTFKQFAERFSLKVEATKTYGWAKTSETEAFKELVAEFKPKPEVFELLRNMAASKKQTTRMLKYQCGCTVVRCATKLDAKCYQCLQTFKRDRGN